MTSAFDVNRHTAHQTFSTSSNAVAPARPACQSFSTHVEALATHARTADEIPDRFIFVRHDR
jgi:hypothetical protein